MATTGILTNPDAEVDVELVKTTLERYGIDIPKRSSVKKLVSLLRNAYKARLDDLPEEEWIKCLECGEITDDDEDLECCPYCGDDGAEEEEAEAAEEAGLDPEDPDVEDPDIDVEEPEKLEDDEDPEAAAKRKVRHEKAEKGEGNNVEESPEDDVTEEAEEVELDDDDAEPEEEEEVDEQTAIDELTGFSITKLRKLAKEKGISAGGSKAELAARIVAADAEPAEPEEEEEVDEQTEELEGDDEETGVEVVEETTKIDASTPQGRLALATERAKVAQRSIATSGWDLGNILREVNEGELWKAGGFSSFKDYHTKELGISKALAYNLMDVAKKFSRATFEEIGIKKLEIVARAPKESREKLLDEAGESSKRDLEKKARDAKKKKEKAEKGDAPPPEKNPATAAGKRGRPSKEDQTITLLTKVGGKPKTYRFKDAASHEEIPEWTKDAYVEVQLSDDVMLYVAPKTDRSGKKISKLAVMFRKIEDDAGDAEK